jgi:hypothetical protein
VVLLFQVLLCQVFLFQVPCQGRAFHLLLLYLHQDQEPRQSIAMIIAVLETTITVLESHQDYILSLIHPHAMRKALTTLFLHLC